MVLILFIPNNTQLSHEHWQSLLQQVPKPMQTRLLQYRRWEDQQAGLFGKLLLAEAIQYFGPGKNALLNYQTDTWQRPFLPGSLDFNISHTSGMVVCAATVDGRVGIDVEKIKPVDLSDYRRVFTTKEYEYISQSQHSIARFYELWTKKEAVMKADGRGFGLDPQHIDALGTVVQIENVSWTTNRISLSSGFDCHLATRLAERQLKIQAVDINTLLS